MVSKKIMVVDDDRDILEVVSVILKMQGMEPIPINNADGLLAKVRQLKPDVVLLDVQLGGHDGRHLCKEMKEVEECANTIVILFSANNRYRDNIHDYLCDDFIEKPFDMQELVAKINTYLAAS